MSHPYPFQRWQDAPAGQLHALNVVFVFETRLFEEVLLDARDRGVRPRPSEAGEAFQALHVVRTRAKNNTPAC
jgi:hypothetical protein